MATVADVQAALANLASKEEVAIQLMENEATSIKTLLQQVTDLQAQVAAGQPVDLQPLLDQVSTMDANVTAAIASVQPPAPAA